MSCTFLRQVQHMSCRRGTSECTHRHLQGYIQPLFNMMHSESMLLAVYVCCPSPAHEVPRWGSGVRLPSLSNPAPENHPRHYVRVEAADTHCQYNTYTLQYCTPYYI